MDKNIKNYTIFQVRSTVYTNQIVNDTATKHSLCPGNGVFAHEKCITFVTLYVFVSKTTKKHDIKKQKKTFIK